MIPSELIVQSLTEGAGELEGYLSDRRGAKVTLRMPQRGTKHQLVEMARKNARDALEKRNARLESQQTRTVGAAKALGEAVGMEAYPRRIDVYKRQPCSLRAGAFPCECVPEPVRLRGIGQRRSNSALRTR